MNKILTYLDQEKIQFQEILTDFLDHELSTYRKLTPEFDFTLENLKEYLLRGGKWHRPALTLLGYRIAGGKINKSIRTAAAAMEVLHRFLLIHDDIVDRDLLRHKGPTIEKIFQEKFNARFPTKKDVIYSQGMAMISGDIVMTLVYELLSSAGIEASKTILIIKAINQLMMETSAGWQLETDQNYMDLDEVLVDDYFTGMKLVSAQYSVVWPLRIGQILAGRAKDGYDIDIETYGINTGLSFQMADDILSIYGDPKVTGKPVGNDYREGKKTLLVLNAYHLGQPETKEFIRSTLGLEAEEGTMARIQSIIKESGSLERSNLLIAEHNSKAKAALKRLKTQDGEAVLLLDQLNDLLAYRDY